MCWIWLVYCWCHDISQMSIPGWTAGEIVDNMMNQALTQIISESENLADEMEKNDMIKQKSRELGQFVLKMEKKIFDEEIKDNNLL